MTDHKQGASAAMLRTVVREVVLFQNLTDREKPAVSGSSNKLFALASIHAATKAPSGHSLSAPLDGTVRFGIDQTLVDHDALETFEAAS